MKTESKVIRGHTFMTSTWKVLKFVTCLWILLFQTIDLLSIFADRVVMEGHKIGHYFCGHLKCMTPKARLGCSRVFQNGHINSQAAVLTKALVGRNGRLVFLIDYHVKMFDSSWVCIS